MRPLNDDDDFAMLDERELPEWLQRESDRIHAEEARDRLLIGLGTMFLVVVFIIGANALLKMQGYGA